MTEITNNLHIQCAIIVECFDVSPPVMKCTIKAYIVLKASFLQPFQRSNVKIKKTFIIHPIQQLHTIQQVYSTSCSNMMTTKRHTRSMQSNSNNSIDTAPPAKKTKKSSAVKKKAVTTDTTNVVVTVPEVEHGKPWYNFFTKGDVEYEAYMAKEWGYEKHGDEALFEKLSLEGAQAGLTWRTVLQKREAYRTTFHQFDIMKVASMTESDIDRILNEQPSDPKNTRTIIVRHRGKIESVIHNAKCILKMREEYNSKKDNVITSDIFSHYLWSFVDHKPILNHHTIGNNVSKTLESESMSTELKKYGFKFVGPTICYSMMQGIGMVIDHPHNTPEWHLAYQRLQSRPGGYQERK
jgi:DNA-3-methyladenine glycosylase I